MIKYKNMFETNKCKSFSPLITDKSEILILGSMPGVKSLEMTEYYANKQNRFWKVVGELIAYNNLDKMDYNSRINILLERKFALWDVIASCYREGSLDSAIQGEVPNNLTILLETYSNIKTICLNGHKSYSAFKKYFPEIVESTKYKIVKLPSTSPANARYSFDKLVEVWRKGSYGI